MTWLTELGTKRTPWDRDGSKHRHWWWAFVLVMVLLIAFLVSVQGGDEAHAAALDCTRGQPRAWSITRGNPDDYNVNYAVTQKANACTSNYRFTAGPHWDHTYAVHHFWQFSKWEKDKFRNFGGIGIAPNGHDSVEYETNVVWAEFKLCPPYVKGLCTHKSFGTKVQVWANGEARSWIL